jgi:type IV secretory pathway VirB10-like protein
MTAPVGNVVDTQPALQDPSTQNREARMMVIVGVMVGMVITSLGYAGYSLVSAYYPVTEEPDIPVSRAESVDTRPPGPPTRPAKTEPSPSPEEEASPTPEADAEAEPNDGAAKSDAVAAHLNQGPVSTGEREQKREDRSGKTIIEMTDGTRVEVDAAWQDNQGVWYRRGGLVSFVESKWIKAIKARQESKVEPVSSPTP